MSHFIILFKHIYSTKNYILTLKLPLVLQLASQTVNTLILAFQTTKTFEKYLIWQNILILPLPHVIF
jgi:hypothetical protein